MNDQCMNCTVRGDLDSCLKTPCSQHKSWYAQTLTAKIKEALAQPERHELQKDGKHSAPCARFCEANAFQIEIRDLKSKLAQQSKTRGNNE